MRASLLVRSLIHTSLLRSTRRYTSSFSMSTFDASTLRVALCQIGAGADKQANIVNAAQAIEKTNDAQLIVRYNCVPFLFLLF